MKLLLEVRTAVIIRATKYDLFTGDVENMHSKQGIKENTTVFYLLGNQCNFRTPNPCRIYRLQGSI
jgi:hypothetical protein